MRLFFLIVSLTFVFHTRHAQAGEIQEVVYQLTNPVGLTNGDYVSSAGGLSTTYRYFAEVVPGQGNLVVELFDPDTTANFDIGASNTAFRIFRPNGTLQETITVNGGTVVGVGACTGCDNAWVQLHQTITSANGLTPGHWRIEVDTSIETVVGSLQGYKLRVSDSTGRVPEVNLYADSYVPVGRRPAAVTHPLHPYVTRGCAFQSGDFDYDTNASFDIASPNRDGNGDGTLDGSTYSFAAAAVSGNGNWNFETISNFASSDDDSVEYGIWTARVSFPGVGNNWGLHYFGEPLTAPPAAQPDPNGFRTYFPNSGGAPVKPYMEQFVRYDGGESPPCEGEETRLRVTIRITNPTSHQITDAEIFSNVPGGTAVYGGAILLSAGAGAGPAVGAGGTVQWRLGTVAPMTSEIFSYYVDVTPSAAGQRVLVTGTPGSNGTFGRWVDETGALGQRFGELCELAVTEKDRLFTSLSLLAANPTPKGTLIRWASSSEQGTIGFELHRRVGGSFEKIEVSLPSVLEALGGAQYAYEDKEGSAEYRLFEIDNRGHKHLLGDVRRDTKQTESPRVAYSAIRKVGQRSLAVPLSPNLDRVRRINGNAVQKIFVTESGIHQLSNASLATALGLAESAVRNLASNGSLRLRSFGSEVGYKATDNGVLFNAEAPDSAFTSYRVYQLDVQPGLQMATAASASDQVALSRERVGFEEDRSLVTAIPSDPENDLWFWEAYAPSIGAAQMPFNLGSVDPSEAATLSVSLKGATDTQHVASFAINGQAVGIHRFEGFAAQTVELSIPTGALVSGENMLSVSGSSVGPLPDISWVDRFEVEYARADSLVPTGHVHAIASGTVDNAAAIAFDVTDPKRPLWLEKQATGWPVIEGHDYRFANQGVTPTALLTDELSSHLISDGSSFVIITPASLTAAAIELANHRNAQGVSTRVVLLEDIYDEVNFGQPDPRATKRFLQMAQQQWAVPPTHVLLFGDGSFDYKGVQDPAGNLIPVLGVSTDAGVFASDTLLADLDGDSRLELAVGRLPVRSLEQAAEVVSAIVQYDTSPGQRQSVWIGQKQTWTNDVHRMASNVPGDWNARVIQLESESMESGQAAVNAAWSASPSLISYLGHGGLDRFGGLDPVAKSDALPQSQAVVLGLTCTGGRFEVPGFDGIGESLVRDGKAIAFWGPTGLTPAGDAISLGHFASASLYQSGLTIGEAFLSAHNSRPSSGFQLLGDPTLRLRSESAVPGHDDLELEVPAVTSAGKIKGATPEAVRPIESGGCSAATGGRSPSAIFLLCSLVVLGCRRRRR